MNDGRRVVERALDQLLASNSDESSWPPVAEKILAARKRAGLSQSEIASLLGISEASEYWDLELYDGDVFQSISISAIAKLAIQLNLPIELMLLSGDPRPSQRTSFADVSRRISSLVDAGPGTVDEVSTQVGWELAPIIENPDAIGRLNVVGLRDVCSAVGVDWVTVILWEEDRMATP